MKPETLELKNLRKVTENVRDVYREKTFLSAQPMMGYCWPTKEKIGVQLYRELEREFGGEQGKRLFFDYVRGVSFQATDDRWHYLIVVGEDKGNITDTFCYGVKLDPTIIQFRDLFPELDNLDGKVVFSGAEYPAIIKLGTLGETKDFYRIILKRVRSENETAAFNKLEKLAI